MVTFHPTTKRTHSPDGSLGFLAMVMVRNPRGQCVGSKVSANRVFPDKEAAKNFARQAAYNVSARVGFEFTRVA
jgi:hypothetical protein